MPANERASDTAAVELGVTVTPDVDGTLTAIRYYKGAGSTGIRTGRVYSSAGQLLGEVTFTDESESGWQVAALAAPIPLTAGATYTVAVHHSSGGYAYQGAYFAAPVTVGHMRAGSGVFRYGPGGTAPTQSWNNTNYWTDLLFTPNV